MHSGESLVGPADGWHESALPLGGQGCPEVAEFAVVEFAAAMGRSTESGRRYLSHAVEGYYRLPRCWARLEAGELAAWRLAFIADRTICLSPGGGGVRGRQGRAVRAHHRPRPAGAAGRGGQGPVRPRPPRPNAGPPPRPGTSTSRSPTPASPGQCASTATSTWPTPWTWRPRSPRTPTSNWPWARPTPSTSAAPSPPATWPAHQHTLDLADPPTQPHQRRSRRVVLHVHLEQAAVLGAGGLARLQEVSGPVTAEQVRDWCANPDAQVTVQPVLDLAEHLHVGSYEASARLRLQTQLRDHTCAFPFCSRPAEQCDCDHRVPPPARDDAGPTCTCNLAPAADATTAPRPPAAGPI